jgi:hypothetical protein
VRRGFAGAVTAAALALVATGCASGSTEGATVGSAAVPHIVMSGADAGYAVWPSGARWIVLGTADGWRTVTNRTPVAVPTDGGLVLTARAGRVWVGVLPFQQLTVSPVLASDGTSRMWSPTQLPSALAPSATAIARSASATWAVLADGSVVTLREGETSWTASTSASELDPTGSLTLAGVSFPAGSIGFLTATRTSGGPTLFVTTDAGATWHDSGVRTGGTAVRPWAPCRIGATWVAPVQVDDRLLLLTAEDPRGPWRQGPPAPVAGTALVTCTSQRVVAVLSDNGSDEFYSGDPSTGWASLGSSGRHLVAVAAASDTVAFGADADSSRVFRVELARPVRVEDVDLPGWVATIGGGAMRN